MGERDNKNNQPKCLSKRSRHGTANNEINASYKARRCLFGNIQEVKMSCIQSDV